MNGKCKDCKYENKCACYDCSRLEREDRFEPKEVEIRPENAGELWVGKLTGSFYHTEILNGKLMLVDNEGAFDIEDYFKDPQNWTCLYRPIEEDVERIEIESVFFKGFEHFGDLRATELNFLGCAIGSDVYSKLRQLDPSTTMKVILEIPKDKS